MKFVSYKDKKEFVRDIKKIYMASNINNSKNALKQFEEKWFKKYNYAVKSWKNNFEELVAFFDFPHEIRKLLWFRNLKQYLKNINNKLVINLSYTNNITLLIKLVKQRNK